MSEKQRRKSPERKKTRQAQLKQRPSRFKLLKGFFSGGIGVWTCEVLSVIFSVVALFLLLSFISYEFSRAAAPLSLGSSEKIAARNVMGPLGHVVGTILSGFLGWGALMPVLWAVALALYFWVRVKNEGEPPFTLKWHWLFIVGVVGSVFAASGLFGVFGGRTAGGFIGRMFAGQLVRYVGFWGGVLVYGSLLLLFVAFALQRSTTELLRGGWLGCCLAGRFFFITLPLGLVNLGLSAVELAVNGWSRFWTWFMPYLIPGWTAAIEEEEEGEALPQPKRRKNLIEQIEVQSEQIEEEDPIEAGKIVVERRKNEPLGLERLAKTKKTKSKKEVRNFEEDDLKYEPPSLQLLIPGEKVATEEDDETLRKKSRIIEHKLKDFGILGRVTHVHPGPVITLFEFKPAPGVKVGRIASLQDDLAMSLKASSIRIIAPIPKRGTVGIEVPNKQREIVRLRDVLECPEYVNAESFLSVPIGKDTYGVPLVFDIAKMPHLLMAGATGTGKSVSINAILLSLLYRAKPSELGLILIDPKILELSVYEGIPHLRVPVVTAPRQAKAVLEWACREMNRRYRAMQRLGVRSIDGYNQVARGESTEEARQITLDETVLRLSEDKIVEDGTIGPELCDDEDDNDEAQASQEIRPLPKIVIVVDELADLMLTVGREIEDLITRLAQKARAAGIHLILATQRPSVDVITGLIKANFPARMSFRVASRIDSRTILDSMGADKLLGRGDMLMMLPGGEHLKRAHGAFVSDAEVTRVVAALKKNCQPRYDEEIVEICQKALKEEEQHENGEQIEGGDGEFDEFYDKAVELVMQKGQASTSMVQRAFRIGYNRAARIIDMMEREGVVGPVNGAKPREVISPAAQEEYDDKF